MMLNYLIFLFYNAKILHLTSPLPQDILENLHDVIYIIMYTISLKKILNPSFSENLIKKAIAIISF